jgi:Ca2+/Na+ antiporter
MSRAMQSIKETIGLGVVFGPAVAIVLVAVFIEAFIREKNLSQTDELMDCWALWGGLLLLVSFAAELRGLAGSVTAWL